MAEKINVRLPDGRVVQVPKGTTKAELTARFNVAPQQVQPLSPAGADLPQPTGPIGAVGAGAQQSLRRLGAGAQQLWQTAAFDTPGKEALRERMAESEARYQAKVADYPLAGLVGEALPYAAMPAGATAARGAAIGAGTGALTYADNPVERAFQTIGGGVGSVAGRRLAGRGEELMNRAPYAREAQELGFQLTPGQRLGSEPLQLAEAGIRSVPFVGQPLRGATKLNAKRMTDLAAESIGESGDLTPAKLGAAKDRIGQEFEKVKNIDVAADDQLLDDMVAIRNEYADVVMNEPALEKDFNLVLKAVNEQDNIPGSAYQNLVSKIRRKAEAQLSSGQGDREQGLALFELKEALDNAAGRSMEPEQLASFENARKQWRNLMLLTGSGRQVVSPSGEVSPLALANVLRRKDRTGYVFGKNQTDLYKLAQISEQIKDIVPTSGTAERQAMQRMMEMGTAGGAGAGAMIDPATTAASLAAGNLAMRGYMGLPSLLSGGLAARALGVPLGREAEEQLF